jgi:CRISPR/Cas system CSM-associated protein Csm3 (group 7 of RAMP superfamily)
MWSGVTSRRIIARVVVEGDLVLQTAAHFGNGDGDDLTDMPLLCDPYDEAEGKITPLLAGASLTGALRSYLREVEHGYGVRLPPGVQSASALLFGGVKGDDDGEQSPLIVEDAWGTQSGVERRDGVGIAGESRTAIQDKKFDLHLWQAGTIFALRFELCIRAEDDEQALKQALVTALAGLSNGAITLGARKQRGYGRVQVENWRVKTYDLCHVNALLDWLQHGNEPLWSQGVQPVSDLAQALGVTVCKDTRSLFHLKADFALPGSLLIRSSSGTGHFGPDEGHLHARNVAGPRGNDGTLLPAPILSGTSVAGAMRARAFKILATLGDREKAKHLVDAIWGTDMEELRQRRARGDRTAQPYASRLRISEHLLQHTTTDLVQHRVSINRFTGGARDTALFSQQPAFGKDNTIVTIEVELLAPQPHEIGLLLLLLKDLWTGDLPLGGESSVGRGRLHGKHAVLAHSTLGTLTQWTLSAHGDAVEVHGDSREALEEYVIALQRTLQEVRT